jgi:hypothetical protein
MYFYNFTNYRFDILENFNYIDQKWIRFKLHIQQKRNIVVIFHV